MASIDTLYNLIEAAAIWDTTEHLPRKAYLNAAGKSNTNLYYILSGSVKIAWFNEKGEENIIRFGYQNHFILALDSFITDKPSDFYIQTLKNTTVKVLSKEKLLQFIASEEAHQKLWDALLLQLILQQLEREKDILTPSPKERYERVLKRSPLLFQEIPNKYIASYLRMSAETLSRLKKY